MKLFIVETEGGRDTIQLTPETKKESIDLAVYITLQTLTEQQVQRPSGEIERIL